MKRNIEYKSRFRILKGGKISLIVSALIGSVTLSFAAPSGGKVVSGTANIQQNGKITNINQASKKASINWQKFNINKDEIVNFNQPNINSITLNRVIGNEKSIINGALNANGQVWILNSNGVLFGKNAKVNTSGFLATTKELTDTDFQNSNYTFTGDSSNSVINEGTIKVQNSSYVVLASNEVRNKGQIEAVKGKIHLSGANEYTLNLNGNSLVDLTINKGVLDAMVENSGTILSDAGEIYLTTNAVNELLKGVVNNTGVIEANSLDGITGKVELFAHGGEVQVGGTIKALDGFVETSGKHFTFNNADIKAGEWLIDPEDITIDASLASSIEAQLASGDMTVQTNSAGSGDGNINVNSEITWSSAQTLTLDAHNDIYINAEITATNANGKLALHYGQGKTVYYYEEGSTWLSKNTSKYHVNAPINLQEGDNFKTKHGSDGDLITWKVITRLGEEGSRTGTDLQGIRRNTNEYYILGANIDASETSTWNDGAGFKPIKESVIFDGLGHTIDGLYINRETENHVALFDPAIGISSVLECYNLGLTNVDITGGDYVGGILSHFMFGIIENSYVTGDISGITDVGGLAGVGGNRTEIHNSYAIVDVSGDSNVGGLVGSSNVEIYNSYAIGTVHGKIENIGGLVGGTFGDSEIHNSYANVDVTGRRKNLSASDNVGGLVGLNGGLIENSYATGDIDGYGDNIGGLVGKNGDSYYGTISKSYATGAVSGFEYIGGLVGKNHYGTITNTYATGAVSGRFGSIGGLVGHGSSITNSYATGLVSGTGSYSGGLAGFAYASNSYWDTQTTGKSTSSGGGTGLTTAQFSDATNFSSWDDTIWTLPSGDSSVEGYKVVLRPYLKDVTLDEHKETTVLFDSGTGVELNPFMITSWEQLQNINFNSDTLSNNYFYELSNNLSNTTTGYDSYASSTANSGAGWNPIGDITNRFTGKFNGKSFTISDLFINSSSPFDVGLFGYIDTGSSISNIGLINVDITGSSHVGSLVGTNRGDIINSYASGLVSGVQHLGGLSGYNYGELSNVYAAVNVNGTSHSIGGLIGQNIGDVANAYAIGNVSGGDRVGGLTGTNLGGTITNTYATGTVTGSSNVAGLVGDNQSGIIANSYWDTQTTGQSSSSGGTGLTTAQMQQQSSYTGFDFTNDWVIYDGYTYPLLRSFMSDLIITLNDDAKTYDGNSYSGGTGYSFSSTPNANLLGRFSYAGDSQGAINRGRYDITGSGLYSNQHGYIISYDKGTLTIENKIIRDTIPAVLKDTKKIDIPSIIKSIKTTPSTPFQVTINGTNFTIAPSVMSEMLNGGINLPFGTQRQFVLNNRNGDEI